MAKFELNYKHSKDFSEKVELEIRLEKRPLQSDYKKMLEAIDILNEVAQKYVKIPPAEKKVTGK